MNLFQPDSGAKNLLVHPLAFRLFVAIFLFAATFSGAFAGSQKDSTRRHKQDILNLSPDQKSKMKELRTQMNKETIQLRNQIREKHARLLTLEMADKADLTAINTAIDEIQALKTKMMKLQAAHKQEIRKLLTPEQRVEFDLRGDHKGKGRPHKGKKHGHGHGPGPGMED
jgi:Spy/CpxP family protein refolding chaperone